MLRHICPQYKAQRPGGRCQLWLLTAIRPLKGGWERERERVYVSVLYNVKEGALVWTNLQTGQKSRHAEMQAGRQESRQAGMQSAWQTDRQTGRQAGRRAGRQKSGQAGRWINWPGGVYQLMSVRHGRQRIRIYLFSVHATPSRILPLIQPCTCIHKHTHIHIIQCKSKA